MSRPRSTLFDFSEESGIRVIRPRDAHVRGRTGPFHSELARHKPLETCPSNCFPGYCKCLRTQVGTAVHCRAVSNKIHRHMQDIVFIKQNTTSAQQKPAPLLVSLWLSVRAHALESFKSPVGQAWWGWLGLVPVHTQAPLSPLPTVPSRQPLPDLRASLTLPSTQQRSPNLGQLGGAQETWRDLVGAKPRKSRCYLWCQYRV
jgi:hypothetical protein